ncbi:MAG TPA: hypothetical protein K8V90_10440 [Romboutsia timonensis]|uniref:Uncharacterized protein n=1 Tax=Romboutsia timonensis TaxID=1776391 RepID=A0A921T0B2_9FIRM|nr:hypothetical protein [Romboutsia timonensis]
MMAPKTTWYVLEDIDGLFEYSPKRTHDMDGSYAPGDTLSVKIQLWNNRLGMEDVQDATNAKLVIFFKNYEDNYLLKLCKVKLNNEEAKPVTIDMDRGLFNLGTISGGANNGSDLNTDNYVEFELQIGAIPMNVKSELKGLVLDVEYDN